MEVAGRKNGKRKKYLIKIFSIFFSSFNLYLFTLFEQVLQFIFFLLHELMHFQSELLRFHFILIYLKIYFIFI